MDASPAGVQIPLSPPLIKSRKIRVLLFLFFKTIIYLHKLTLSVGDMKMDFEKLYLEFDMKYKLLQKVLNGSNVEEIKKLALEVHALVHPAVISGKKEKTIADYVLEYMLAGNQNELVQRKIFDTDLHYDGSDVVPMCWQLWHTYRIEDLISNILMANQEQIFNDDWQKKIGANITDTGNALELEQAIEFGKKINMLALRDYMIAVGKNTRQILNNLTLKQVQSMVPEEWIMKILEVGGVTTDFRSVWLLVFWGRLTVGGMILTPITNHHMMHLPVCLKKISAK